MGAYERGERALSVGRLLRLAELYDVPADQLLPREEAVDIDLTRRPATDPVPGFTIDLVRLNQLDDTDAQVLSRYAATIPTGSESPMARKVAISSPDESLRAQSSQSESPYAASASRVEANEAVSVESERSLIILTAGASVTSTRLMRISIRRV